MNRISTKLLILFVILPFQLNAQKISGLVYDVNGPLIGAEIKGTTSIGDIATVTDTEGRYTLFLSPGKHKLKISYKGYERQKMKIALVSGEIQEFNFEMEKRKPKRYKPKFSSPKDFKKDDFIGNDLLVSGRNTLEEALTYKMPSFNAVNFPTNDVNSIQDAYEIRNMGPSRTLILINGKRKNISSILYTRHAPGQNESSVDLSVIPLNAIERIEMMDDGSAARYGSDAIAGVMNIILKKDSLSGSLIFRGGITGKGDGASYGIALNNGMGIGKKGFINYTLDLSKLEQANRSGAIDAVGEAGDFGATLMTVQEFLTRHPDGKNISGPPGTTAAKFTLNTGFNINENSEVYANMNYAYKLVNSFANYRTPYWRTIQREPYLADFFPGDHPINAGGYDGYQPTFDGKLLDYNGTIGFNYFKNNFNTDVSITIGGNGQDYSMKNSQNRTIDFDPFGVNKYRENSPTDFELGGNQFSHLIGNIDVSKSLFEKMIFAFGSEIRREVFTILEGDVASYEGSGADSYKGNDLKFAGSFNRFNFGGYSDIVYNFNEEIKVNGTVRLDNYSDFGSTFIYKLGALYKTPRNNLSIKASYSTGFKAPLLQQIYSQGESRWSDQGGFGIDVFVNNVSLAAEALGIDKLGAEKSTSINMGLEYRPNRNLTISLDYYNIAIKDRIILSRDIVNAYYIESTTLDSLYPYNLSRMTFYLNAMDSRTSGIDFTTSFMKNGVGNTKLNVNFSANYTFQNKRDGPVKNPEIIKASGQSVSNAEFESSLFTSRPKYKGILGIKYEIGKMTLLINNTLFGPSKFRLFFLRNGLYIGFEPKIVTDLGLTYKITKKINLAINTNNVLNIIPKWNFKADPGAENLLNNEALLRSNGNLLTFNQRYDKTTYYGYHFSQLGIVLNMRLTILL